MWDCNSLYLQKLQQRYFCTLYFPFAWCFRPLCVEAGKPFSSHQPPLSNNIQRCHGGKLWIRCYVNHNMHRLHQCYKLFSWSQQNIRRFFFFSNTKQDLSPRVETTLDSREQHPLPKFELNSIAYPHSSVSNPNASPVKKMPLAIVTSASLWLRIFLVLKRTLFICQYWLLSSPQQDKRLFLSHSLENYMHASFAHKKAKYGSKMQHEAFRSLLRNCFQMSLFFFFLFWRLVFGTWRLIITKNAYTGQFCNIIWA